MILPPSASTEIPDCFHAEFMGLTSHQDWRNHLLWEEDAEVVLAERRLPMVPFVPVLKGGQGRRQVERAAQILRSEARLTELEPLLAFFASFVMDVKLVQRIMRWDMIELRESPWYNQILEEGLEEGLQQGLRQAHQIALDDLVRVLRHRFGALPRALEDQVRALETSQLRGLFDEALDAPSPEAFLDAIPQPPEGGR